MSFWVRKRRDKPAIFQPMTIGRLPKVFDKTRDRSLGSNRNISRDSKLLAQTYILCNTLDPWRIAFSFKKELIEIVSLFRPLIPIVDRSSITMTEDVTRRKELGTHSLVTVLIPGPNDSAASRLQMFYSSGTRSELASAAVSLEDGRLKGTGKARPKSLAGSILRYPR